MMMRWLVNDMMRMMMMIARTKRMKDVDGKMRPILWYGGDDGDGGDNSGGDSG